MAYQIVVGGHWPDGAWPDGAAPQTVVCPVLGTITKKSIGPIPIPPNTGKYWPIPNTGIVGTLLMHVKKWKGRFIYCRVPKQYITEKNENKKMAPVSALCRY